MSEQPTEVGWTLEQALSAYAVLRMDGERLREEIEVLQGLLIRWRDAAFDFHDRHSMTQPVTERVGNLIDETTEALEHAGG